jgi:hypothetical protein
MADIPGGPLRIGEHFDCTPDGLDKMSKLYDLQLPSETASVPDFNCVNEQFDPENFLENCRVEAGQWSMSRAVDDDPGFKDWWQLVKDKDPEAKKDVTIISYKEGSPDKTYVIEGCVPTNHTFSQFSSQSGAVRTETLTLNCKTMREE